jgi:hypothetical protein
MSLEFEKLIKIVYGKWQAKIRAKPEEHPDEEDLSAFVQNELSQPEAARIKKHILSCQVCGERLAVSIKLKSIEELEPPEKLLDSCRGLINKEISGRTLEIVLAVKEKLLYLLNATGDVLVGQELVPAAVLRSRKIESFKDEITILKDFQDIRVEAKIRMKENNNFDLLVILKDKSTQESKKDFRISLYKSDVELESYLAESGKAVFADVLSGKYTVEISGLEDNVANISLDLQV